jgi:hypothetical protein
MSTVRELVEIILELNQKVQDQKYLIDSLHKQVIDLQNRVIYDENKNTETVNENDLSKSILNEQQTW